MRRIILFSLILSILFLSGCSKKIELDADLSAHDAIALWEDEIPYEDASSDIPSILPYLVDSEEKTACMIVCPGGAYQQLAIDMEGIESAEALNEKGISAFVLQYRIAPADHEAIMEDVLRAVRFVKYFAEEFNIDPERVGVMGFSAGGHLALMSLEHFDMALTKTDEIDDESSKPALGVLCYPVVSMEEDMTHEKTRANFLGADIGDEKMLSLFSGEQSVRADMAPFFVWHSRKDAAAPVEGTLALVEAAKENGVDCYDLIYDFGSHGVGMAQDMNIISGWFDECVKWLKDKGFCK